MTSDTSLASTKDHAMTDGLTTEPRLVLAYRDAPTRNVRAGGVDYAYRDLGPRTGVPVVFLTHLTANLDNWDPRVVDGLAATRRVITFDNRGIGATSGTVPETVEAMADDTVAFIRALGLGRVDLLGFSLGGMIAQVIALRHPLLVRRMILAGTGPAGGAGIDRMTGVFVRDVVRASLTFRDPKALLFFTRTPNGRRAAKDFLGRLKERRDDRDDPMAMSRYRFQLRAIHAWGTQPSADLSRISQPVLIANGEDDRMVPSSNSVDLHRRIPGSVLVLYPDAGHGGIFQYHEPFVAEALAFLDS